MHQTATKRLEGIKKHYRCLLWYPEQRIWISLKAAWFIQTFIALYISNNNAEDHVRKPNNIPELKRFCTEGWAKIPPSWCSQIFSCNFCCRIWNQRVTYCWRNLNVILDHIPQWINGWTKKNIIGENLMMIWNLIYAEKTEGSQASDRHRKIRQR